METTYYYFLASLLPQLEMGHPPALHYSDLLPLLRENLTERDFSLVEVMRRLTDLDNIRALWLERGVDPRGNFTGVELEEALNDGEGLPDYVYTFMRQYDKLVERLRRYSKLYVAYFREEGEEACGFLARYLRFEREWRLVFVGFRAKKAGRDLAVELQDEDPYDPLVAQLMAQKDGKVFDPPYGYELLRPLFEEHMDAPLLLHKALCEYRFGYIEKMKERELFSVDVVLGYFAQLSLVERWIELDSDEGKQVVNRIV
ncbi:DUF2764 family protein [Simkania negevensis]|uniref:DUF2764 family protein n=1 Tax=Simkania negevensis TaxID=83561 RepID=A0ABS3AQ96_9BACT|nr:DUF2764 family protein [Simkania negevensis]